MIHLHVFILMLSTYLIGGYSPMIKNEALEKTTIDVAFTRNIASQALAFCKKQRFNTDFCILIDMRLHSGVKRFFVWDFKKGAFTNSFLVSHGCGNHPWSLDLTKENPQFSNTDGSHCSSLGKYKIGARAYSSWGVHVKYVLHGLEPTNSNASKRFIVFHSWDAVSDVEVYPNGTPEGWGCPTISNNSFKMIDPLIQSSKKPVLFWMYR